jgi:signal transduction histidine kinase
MKLFNSEKREIIRSFTFILIAIAVIGGFLSFLFLAITESTSDALLIGYFYAVTLVIVLSFVQRVVINKLQVFNPVQQWTLRTLIYIIAISAVYLSGLLFQLTILTPQISFGEILSEGFWSSFVAFISSPLDLKFSADFFREEFRAVLIPFFAIIILIGLVSIIGSYVQMRWQQNRQQQAIDRAELTALKAQIEPHFLFNSLNTIASWIKIEPKKAEQLIIKLSDILRYLFENTSREMVSIEEEINFLKKYLELMQARFDKRLHVHWHQALQDKSLKVPVFILQPIVENALRHGWMNDRDILKIEIIIEENEKGIFLSVHDNGQGMDIQRLKMLPIPGHALSNISNRLQLVYKKSDLLRINSTYEKGTMVSITIPKDRI